MCVTGLAGMYNLQKLSPEVIPPSEIYAGTPVLLRLRLHNAKRLLPSFLISVRCEGSKGITFPVIPSSKTVECVIRAVFDARGRTKVGKVMVSSVFPVNFFNRYLSYDLDTEFLVFPQLIRCGARGEGSEPVRSGSAFRQSRGLDGEIEGIADYSGREPLRMIHWKLSARGDELLVKEFGRQAASPVVISLADMPGQTLEERISHAAWLIKHWCSMRPVGLRLETDIFPAEAGHHYGLRLLTALALYGEQSR
ncbi:DUF58 domain-containing protein [Pelotalea chapellei]|nr:DUF58 domain-containing protein [Pelotalea chapellei]